MLRFILLLIGLAASVFTIAMSIRFGLRGANAWDQRICNKLNSSFTGFKWHFRIPLAIGVIPEYFYFLVLGRRNYFSNQWWALRAGSYLSLLLFIAALFNRSAVESYYSLSTLSEHGVTALFTSGSAYWYLNMVNLLYVSLFALIIIESIRMHKGWAPVRSILYIVMSILMSLITLSVLILLIAISILYIAYKIIKFFMTSSRRRKAAARDDDDGVSETLNNNYRIFRAELYAWENERKSASSSIKEEEEAIKTKDLVKRAMGGILFIDEAYAIAEGGSNSGSDDFGKKAIAALIKEMEDHRGEFGVIVAGYTDNMKRFLETNPGIKSRFDKTFHFEDFTEDELWEIAMNMLAQKALKADAHAEKHIKKYIAHLYKNRNKFFGNARSIRKLVEKAYRNQELRMAGLQKAKRTKKVLATLKLEDVLEFDAGELKTEKTSIGYKFGA